MSLLLDPNRASQTAPERATVQLETTRGTVAVEIHRGWSPHGVDRFFSLVRAGFYDGVAFHRVIAGFMCQVGIHADPRVTAAWGRAPIQDDPQVPGVGNTRGMLSFAKPGAPNARTTQFFINFSDNSQLDGMGFTPFGQVQDMGPIDELYAGYGECGPRGHGPEQSRSKAEGATYWKAEFPHLDYITRATVAV